MAKPSAGRGGNSSDEEEDNDPETLSEMNRIMGRDKPPKQTSSSGMSLAERAQARMKAAQGTRKAAPQPGHVSHVSSLTQHVPHNFGTSSSSSSSSSSHHGHTQSTIPSKTGAHPSSHDHELSFRPQHNQHSGGHHVTPSISTNHHAGNSSPSRKGKTLASLGSSSKDLLSSSDSHLISSPMMRNMPPPVSGNSHHPPPPPPDDEDEPHPTHSKTKSKVADKNSKGPPSPTLAEHYRTLSVGPPSMKEQTKPVAVDDDIDLEPPDIDEDDEDSKSKKKKKKKKGFFGKLKKAVGKKKDKDGKNHSDSESEEETEEEAKEMQADIDRIMRGKVAKPGAPTTTAPPAGKGLSLQERAALAQKRAAGKS